MIAPNCDHQCSGNCRRVGCNCECGEYHDHYEPEEGEEPQKTEREFSPAQESTIEKMQLEAAHEHDWIKADEWGYNCLCGAYKD